MKPLLLGAVLLLPGFAQAEDFAVDPVHTRILVGVEHAGFSRALGTVSGTTGRLVFEPGWSAASVDVSIPLAKLDFGDVAWNRAVQRLLATGPDGVARFVSDRVTPRDAQHAEVCGTFTLHGIARPLCLEATFNAAKRHPMPPFRRTAGFSAIARLDRFDYGVDAWPTLVGREVEIRIELEASRGIGAPATTPHTDEDATP